jgi:hypothetical protein
MLTPNGFFVAARMAAVCSRICAGLKRVAPRIPSPPALETAATKGTEVPEPIPPSTIGWTIPKRSQIPRMQHHFAPLRKAKLRVSF